MNKVWLKVEIKGLDDCWPYKGYIAYDGYGEYRKQRAHRVVFEESRGAIPAGSIVMHRCNNRRCCNPAHLQAGTHSENSQHGVVSNSWKPGISGCVGVRYESGRDRWIAAARLNGIRFCLYQGRNFFEACCARKSWDAKQTV